MTPKKVCRVCGKEYEPCHTTALQSGVFRWREVSCSPECGAIYLRRIQESRGLIQPETKKTKFKKYDVKTPDAEIVANSEDNIIVGPNRD